MTLTTTTSALEALVKRHSAGTPEGQRALTRAIETTHLPHDYEIGGDLLHGLGERLREACRAGSRTNDACRLLTVVLRFVDRGLPREATDVPASTVILDPNNGVVETLGDLFDFFCGGDEDDWISTCDEHEYELALRKLTELVYNITSEEEDPNNKLFAKKVFGETCLDSVVALGTRPGESLALAKRDALQTVIELVHHCDENLRRVSASLSRLGHTFADFLSACGDYETQVSYLNIAWRLHRHASRQSKKRLQSGPEWETLGAFVDQDFSVFGDHDFFRTKFPSHREMQNVCKRLLDAFNAEANAKITTFKAKAVAVAEAEEVCDRAASAKAKGRCAKSPVRVHLTPRLLTFPLIDADAEGREVEETIDLPLSKVVRAKVEEGKRGVAKLFLTAQADPSALLPSLAPGPLSVICIAGAKKTLETIRQHCSRMAELDLQQQAPAGASPEATPLVAHKVSRGIPYDISCEEPKIPEPEAARAPTHAQDADPGKGPAKAKAGGPSSRIPPKKQGQPRKTTKTPDPAPTRTKKNQQKQQKQQKQERQQREEREVHEDAEMEAMKAQPSGAKKSGPRQKAKKSAKSPPSKARPGAKTAKKDKIARRRIDFASSPDAADEAEAPEDKIVRETADSKDAGAGSFDGLPLSDSQTKSGEAPSEDFDSPNSSEDDLWTPQLAQAQPGKRKPKMAQPKTKKTPLPPKPAAKTKPKAKVQRLPKTGAQRSPSPPLRAGRVRKVSTRVGFGRRPSPSRCRASPSPRKSQDPPAWQRDKDGFEPSRRSKKAKPVISPPTSESPLESETLEKSTDEEIFTSSASPSASPVRKQDKASRPRPKKRKRQEGSPRAQGAQTPAMAAARIDQDDPHPILNSSPTPEWSQDLEASLLTSSTGGEADVVALGELVQRIMAARREKKSKKRKKMVESFQDKLDQDYKTLQGHVDKAVKDSTAFSSEVLADLEREFEALDSRMKKCVSVFSKEIQALSKRYTKFTATIGEKQKEVDAFVKHRMDTSRDLVVKAKSRADNLRAHIVQKMQALDRKKDSSIPEISNLLTALMSEE